MHPRSLSTRFDKTRLASEREVARNGRLREIHGLKEFAYAKLSKAREQHQQPPAMSVPQNRKDLVFCHHQSDYI